MNFWDTLFTSKKVILGLSPMDGITDGAMRYMTAKFSRPDVMFSEFISVDAIHYAKDDKRERLLKILMRARDVGELKHKPYEVAQVFGKTPELFVEAAMIVEKLGFDGIDINMGCPMHKVEDQGSGAGLIRTPELAQEIIKAVKSATKIPVSVKTRIGIDHDIAEVWMATLMEAKPACISLHGRTLRQLYQGKSDWEAIKRAGEVVHKLGGYILGNGDVGSIEDAKFKIKDYGVDGVLIGRAAEGNPAIFQSQISNSQISNGEPSKEQRLTWMVEHAKLFEKINKPRNSRENDVRWFMPMRKHLAWYCKGFPGAVEVRTRLMQANSAGEVTELLIE